ncbi:MAG: tetratricopeptide repeat protein [Hymenobacter sp.]|nr:MAG: tetratricopeptide repeat protein [Hymenobacter sp.]
MAKELEDKLHQRILQLSKAGDESLAAGNYSQAIGQFRTAFALVPEPYQEWEASLWLLTALGEAYYFAGEYELARAALTSVMHVPGAIGNAFVHLRLGQVQFELGNTQQAADELVRAYMGGGKEIFEEEDGKYVTFLQAFL